MIFGKRLISVVAGTGLVIGTGLVDASGPEWSVDVLVRLLKEQRESSVAFEEVTYSSLLTEPLKVRGLLRFTPPSTMEKLITDPFHERYVIDGDRVTIESERKHVKRTISLEDFPVLHSFVDAFLATFTGDVLQLQKVYEVTIDGTRGKWTLLLRPRATTETSLMDYILFTGSEGRVATIAIRSPDGDRSVMTLRRGAAR